MFPNDQVRSLLKDHVRTPVNQREHDAQQTDHGQHQRIREAPVLAAADPARGNDQNENGDADDLGHATFAILRT